MSKHPLSSNRWTVELNVYDVSQDGEQFMFGFVLPADSEMEAAEAAHFASLKFNINDLRKSGIGPSNWHAGMRQAFAAMCSGYWFEGHEKKITATIVKPAPSR